MDKEEKKKIADVYTSADNTSNNTVTEQSYESEKTFDEQTKYLLQKLLQETIAALQEYADPLSINVGELLDQLNTLQKTITQGADLFRVILLISALTDLREKQDSHIMQLLRGNMELLDTFLFQTLYQILHLPDTNLYHIGTRILQQNGCYKQPTLAKKYLPIPVPRFEPRPPPNIPYTELLEQINWTPAQFIKENIHSEQDIKPVQIFKSKQKEPFQWKDELELLYQVLPDNTVIKVREWAIQPTYQESLKRLQAISFFIAKRRVTLLINDENTDLDKYQIKKVSKTTTPTPTTATNESQALQGEAVVFTLTYPLWEHYMHTKSTRNTVEMEVIHQ